MTSLSRGPLIAFALFASLLASASGARAQEMSAAERSQALSRVRRMADCMERQRNALARLMRLIRESEQQRDAARDARVRRDAERAIDALIARAAGVQREARACFEGESLPAPPTDVIVRDPPPDPAAESVASDRGTVRSVETDARLSDHIRVVRGEQVDGQGRVGASVIQQGVRRIASRLERCYASYLDRGSIDARQLDLVFTLRGSSRARGVAVERSGFSDARFERCVRTAGARLRFSERPQGGEATFSYRLRFGR